MLGQPLHEDNVYKVLIVENNPTITRLLKHFFEQSDSEVTVAENGLEALVILDTYLPDIIVTDIIMPKIGGDQLCQIIRNSLDYKDIFLVVHSSVTVEDTVNIFNLDADVYIAKGNTSHYKSHIQHILEQFKNGIRRDQKIIGDVRLPPREITEELLLAKQHHQTIFENIADAVLELDADGKIIQVNRAATILFDQSVEHLLSKKLIDYLSGPDLTSLKDWLSVALKSNQDSYKSDFETPLIINNKRVILKIVSFAEGDNCFYTGIIQDISPQKAIEARLENTLSQLDAVIDTIDYGVCFVDKQLQLRLINKAFRRMWGINKKQLSKTMTFSDLMYFNRYNNFYDVEDYKFDSFVQHTIEKIKQGAIDQTEIVLKDGRVFRYQCSELPNAGRMLTYYDITSLRETQDELAEMLKKVSAVANHDPLTKLANLRLAKEKINMSLAMAKRQTKQVAIMFIDLDGFKEVNDSFGHEAGDQVLIMVANRLRDIVSRGTDTIARIGGDEFIIVQTEVKNLGCVKDIAQKIVSSLDQPFEITKDQIAKIGASIGIAMYPKDGETGADLLKRADNAMYHIKREGKNGYIFSSDC